MENQIDGLEAGKIKRKRTSTVLAVISLVTGILACIPYLSLLMFYLIYNLYGYQKILGVFGDIGLVPGFLCGVPFGLTAIITGIVTLARKPRVRRNVILAIIGILLGVCGILGHFWYFATCQFCQ